MININIKSRAGIFAENKDVARDLRMEVILPALQKGEEVVLDFDQVEGATQSFVHALISAPFKNYGELILDKIKFKNCNDTIREIVTIVTEYLQEAQK